MFDYQPVHGYAEAKPFPHAVISDAWEYWTLREAKKEIRDFMLWDGEKNFFGSVKKRFCGDFGKLPPNVCRIISEASSDKFIAWLESFTGEKGLIADPYLEGGGVHSILPGGFLKMHTDFNWHHRLHAWRRLNVLLYLNEDWREEWGGALELGTEKKILPTMNTMVVFTTDDKSFHGHPEPLASPEPRDSIALYYYTKTDPGVPQRTMTNYQ